MFGDPSRSGTGLVACCPADRRIKAVVFDIDGVVWRSFAPVKHAPEVIRSLQAEAGVQVSFLSNFSSISRAELSSKLAHIGVAASPDEIVTASSLTARYLRATLSDSAAFVAIGGGQSLVDELRGAGLHAASIDRFVGGPRGDYETCVLVIGYNQEFGFDDAARVLDISPRVSAIFATERDRWFGSSNGPIPATGWIVAAIEELVGRRATTLGKPNGLGVRTVADQLGVHTNEMLVVGDSARADVAAARNAGALSCLFRDPDLGASEAIDGGPSPDYVISDLRELYAVLADVG